MSRGVLKAFAVVFVIAAFAAGGFGYSIAGLGTFGTAIAAGAVVAAQYYLAHRNLQDGLGSGRADTRRTFTADSSPARWILGEARVGGQVVFLEEIEDLRSMKQNSTVGVTRLRVRALHMVMVISEGNIQSINKFWIDGEEIPINSSRYRLFDYRQADTNAVYDIGNYFGLNDVEQAGNIRALIDTPKRLVTPIQTPDPGFTRPYEFFLDGEYRGLSNELLRKRRTIKFGLVNPGLHLSLYDYTALIDNRVVAWLNTFAYTTTGAVGKTDPRRFDSFSASHKLTGLTYAHVLLLQDIDNTHDGQNWTKIPNINFLVQGLKITWPGQTTPKWTNNAAAIRYWWLRERRGIPASAIDEDSVRAAIRVCDEVVTAVVPTGYPTYGYNLTGKRYTFDGIIRSDDNHEAVEVQMDIAWQGYAIERDGKIFFRPGVDRTISRHITDDDIMQQVEVRPQPALQDRVNTVRVKLAQSSAHKWVDAELPEVTDPVALAADGEKLTLDLGPWAYVLNPITALRLMSIILRRSRASASYTYQLTHGTNMQNLLLKPTDRITITDSVYGLVRHKVVLSSVTILPDWSVQIECSDAPDGIYLAPETVSPSPIQPPPALPPSAPAPSEGAGGESEGADDDASEELPNELPEPEGAPEGGAEGAV